MASNQRQNQDTAGAEMVPDDPQNSPVREKIETLKKEIRSFCLSAGGNFLSPVQLARDYFEMMGKEIRESVREVGFGSLMEFLQSIDSEVIVLFHDENAEVKMQAVTSEDTKHLERLVERQKRRRQLERFSQRVPPKSGPRFASRKQQAAGRAALANNLIQKHFHQQEVGFRLNPIMVPQFQPASPMPLHFPFPPPPTLPMSPPMRHVPAAPAIHVNPNWKFALQIPPSIVSNVHFLLNWKEHGLGKLEIPECGEGLVTLRDLYTYLPKVMPECELVSMTQTLRLKRASVAVTDDTKQSKPHQSLQRIPSVKSSSLPNAQSSQQATTVTGSLLNAHLEKLNQMSLTKGSNQAISAPPGCSNKNANYPILVNPETQTVDDFVAANEVLTLSDEELANEISEIDLSILLTHEMHTIGNEIQQSPLQFNTAPDKMRNVTGEAPYPATNDTSCSPGDSRSSTSTCIAVSATLNTHTDHQSRLLDHHITEDAVSAVNLASRVICRQMGTPQHQPAQVTIVTQNQHTLSHFSSNVASTTTIAAALPIPPPMTTTILMSTVDSFRQWQCPHPAVTLRDLAYLAEKGNELDRSCEVIVTHVESPGNFFIRLNLFDNKLTELLKHMRDVYLVSSSAFTLQLLEILPNLPVAVGFGDTWHRALVLQYPSYLDNTVLVYLADKGDTLRVNASGLRKLPLSFLLLPFQAIRSRVSDVVSTSGQNWSPEASRLMIQFFSIVVHCFLQWIDGDLEEPEFGSVLPIAMLSVELCDVSSEEDFYLGQQLINYGFGKQQLDNYRIDDFRGNLIDNFLNSAAENSAVLHRNCPPFESYKFASRTSSMQVDPLLNTNQN